MQVPSDIVSDTEPDRPNDMLDAALIADHRGLRAWHAFLRAHASLMRSLAADLADRTGLPSATSTCSPSSRSVVGSCG